MLFGLVSVRDMVKVVMVIVRVGVRMSVLDGVGMRVMVV